MATKVIPGTAVDISTVCCCFNQLVGWYER
jgi:hypothetical protein